ncbi:MAG: helix-turn-helix domain-containing protein [Myxococcaceae bacterium]|nr:helix-turn-helix domain-containing protein [Myxococcaceae bacterium]
MPARIEVFAVAAQAMVRAAALHGVSERVVSRACGGSRLPDDPLGTIASSAADAICVTAASLTGAPTLGLEAAQLVVGDAWPLVDTLAAASATLGAAFEAISGAFDAIDPRCRFEVARHRGELRIRFSVGPDRLPPPALAEDFTWATLVLRLRRAVGVPFTPARLNLVREAPPDGQPWAMLFGVRPRFRATTSELTLTSGDAARPMRTPSPLLVRALEPLVGRARRDEAGFVERTERLVDRLLPRGAVTLEHVARALRVSPRTLQRRLQARGTTWDALVTGRRVARAAELLVDGASVSAASRAVGFADQTSLTRAFRRTWGVSPSTWRRGQRSRPDASSGR